MINYLESKNKKELVDFIKETNHEYNNSLTAILGFSQIMMSSDKLDDSLRSYMDTIYEAALDSKSLIDKINQPYKGEIKHEDLKSSTPVNALIESAISMANIKCREDSKLKGKAIRFTRNLGPEAQICAHAYEVRRVILNILLNAIDSVEDGGEVCIESTFEEGEILIIIKDNGKGMEDGTLDKLFDPYFTTKGDDGTGLGLSISRKIMEDHGGRIEVESKKNLGSTFKIYF